jgi:hypothetical protein
MTVIYLNLFSLGVIASQPGRVMRDHYLATRAAGHVGIEPVAHMLRGTGRD